MRFFVFSILLCLALPANAQPGLDEPVGPVKPVEVVNEILTIEGVVSLDVPDADRFQIRVPVSIPDGAAFSSESLNIPPGKRLLIDHITADIRLPDTQRGFVKLLLAPVTSEIGGDDSGFLVDHTFPLQDADGRISTSPGYRSWFLAQEVDLWADTIARVTVVRGPNLDGPIPDVSLVAAGTISLSGRIVEIPSP